ncbi:hypothetical protein FNV43_RR21607 [Rhamnella rubrinervis]|uniref:Uncharacterized protein n=1 Tax=Rhamnella rubrinervis TaxID=2594499 RepID=A0A8K0DNP8_9ROSA|nr:hypothetical protein FNV43_RR21607 [Rhamnella rubrinervis]
MDPNLSKALSLRDAHSSVSLEPQDTEATKFTKAKLTEKVLIHGLPFKLLHLGIGLKIGNKIGGLHESIVTSRLVVAQRFLRCGMLNHITRRCKFSKLAAITTTNKVATQLYDPWFRMRVVRGVSFANIIISEDHCCDVTIEFEAFNTDKTAYSPILENSVETTVEFAEDISAGQDSMISFLSKSVVGRDYYESIRVMCPNINSLSFTINKLFLGGVIDFQNLVSEKVRKHHYNVFQLSLWARHGLELLALA